MSQAYKFLKECGVFYIATVNEGAPAVRPFGAVLEFEGELYVSTAKYKSVYEQFVSDKKIQIIALKTGTRDWIRIDGKVVEAHDLLIKQAMLDEYPNLAKRFDKDSVDYALFKITEMEATVNVGGEFVRVD